MNKHKQVQKGWGSEEWIVNNDFYCGKILRINQGYSGSLHFHQQKHETFYVDSGTLQLEIADPATGALLTQILNAGESYVLPPCTVHRFTALTPVKLIEFSTTHRDEDTFRVAKGASQV